MKFYGPEDLTDENFEKFCQEIDEIRKRGHDNILNESSTPQFTTVEEAVNYYHKFGALTFEEWENKMRDKYNI